MRFIKRRKRTPHRRTARPRVLDLIVDDLAKTYASKTGVPVTVAYAGYMETCPGCGHMFSCGHIANRERTA